MTFTVREFEDLLAILEAQPEWRGRLRRALFPEIDIPKALQELAEAQRQTAEGLLRLEKLFAELAISQEEMRRDLNVLKQDVGVLKQDVGVLKQDVGVLKQDVGVLKQDVGVLKQDVGVLKQDVGKLKGKAQEDYYRTRAGGIFGRFLRNGRDVVNRVADRLYTALHDGLVTDEEVEGVLAADLLWGGEDRQSREQIILVMEASWLAEEQDVERALARAAVLQRIGLRTVPVVGGDEWTDRATHMARQYNVVRTVDGQIDPASWRQAQASLRENGNNRELVES